MRTKLSVVVPVYNVENYLKKCINSILSQTFKDFELILVDDGSTDNSGHICDEYDHQYEKVKVIHKENGGLSSARNAGIEIATGEYISFIDSDDYIDSNMFLNMIEALQNTNKDIAACGRVVDLWGEREKIEFSLKKEKVYSREQAIEEVLLLRDIDVAAWDKIYRKFLFDSIRYPEGKISEDAAIIFQMLDISNGVVHVGTPFYHYIYRKNSISKSEYNRRQYDSYINCVNTEQFISQLYPQFLKQNKIYNTQVCGALLQSLSADLEVKKKYESDYKEFKRKFNEGYWTFLFTEGICIKKKIKLSFVYLNLYHVFIILKKSLSRRGYL